MAFCSKDVQKNTFKLSLPYFFKIPSVVSYKQTVPGYIIFLLILVFWWKIGGIIRVNWSFAYSQEISRKQPKVSTLCFHPILLYPSSLLCFPCHVWAATILSHAFFFFPCLLSRILWLFFPLVLTEKNALSAGVFFLAFCNAVSTPANATLCLQVTYKWNYIRNSTLALSHALKGFPESNHRGCRIHIRVETTFNSSFLKFNDTLTIHWTITS